MTRRMLPVWLWAMLIGALTTGVAWADGASGREPGDSDNAGDVQWYVLMLRDKPAGWARFSEKRADDRITTEHVVNMAVARGGRSMRITMRGRFVETAEGQPIEAGSQQELGAMRKSTTVRFTNDGVMITRKQGGRERTSERPPFEGDWLTPAAAARYVERQLETDAEKITYRTFDPMAGMQPIESTMIIGERQPIEVFGRTVPATKVTTTVSNAPGMESVGYVDRTGAPLKVEMKMGFIELAMLAADEQLAKAQVRPPELLVSTLVKPDAPIESPRALKRATYRLRLVGDDGGALPKLDHAGSQRYERADDGRSTTVTVDLDRPADQAGEAPKVRHSMAIDGRDDNVVALADKATKGLDGDAPPAARAEAMRRFVFDYIDAKTLDVGLASASEVARTGRGDCTEHAVLLAAMLRAHDVPSRTVSGLTYVEQAFGRKHVFGYHMWTQAWLDGGWVDLDATLGPETRFDAAHIALGYSAMDDGEQFNDMVALAPLFGRLKIETRP